MPLIPCPICGKSFDPATSAAMPFCSPRCRQIDTGRWLGENYAVPVIRNPEEDEEGEFVEPADDE